MKRIIFCGFVLGIIVMFASPVMAKKDPGSVPAPTGLTCDATTTADHVLFDWDDVTVAEKYSLDVEFELDLDGDGENDTTVEFSFGTSDRTDGALISDSFLNVPKAAFAIDTNDDGVPDQQLTGPGTAKVKGLDPGKGKGRQNNLFSLPCEFTL